MANLHAYTHVHINARTHIRICTCISSIFNIFVCFLAVHTLSAAIEMDKLDANLEQQFDLNLIEAVKMNPVIYDRSHYNYKHFVRKAQTWKQIAETLGVSGK